MGGDLNSLIEIDINQKKTALLNVAKSKTP
jgi:hypothetical protein